MKQRRKKGQKLNFLQKILLMTVVLILQLVGLPLLFGRSTVEQEHVKLLYFKQKAWDFAEKYRDRDAIVVSKKDHLLYYFRKGELVRNEQWQGFTYDFPVRVALASKYFRTPEGEMYIDAKNPRSQYILFLSFSGPGAYGIHSAATKFSRYLDRMERQDPDFRFATLKDDTRGCVQVENRVIKYLYSQVSLKTPVLILPD
ncbi:MAG: L,D-transpeptidase [Candidatus Saganbacteria bacterium]|nr:L,D-transpeptidase [Candidatus Saganbacteria bacterium]